VGRLIRRKRTFCLIASLGDQSSNRKARKCSHKDQ
jgi:hypothetical protein